MKDHDIRELVNTLTKAAVEAKDLQCLREVIAGHLVEPLHVLRTERNALRDILEEIVNKAPYKYHKEGVTIYIPFVDIEQARAALKQKSTKPEYLEIPAFLRKGEV